MSSPSGNFHVQTHSSQFRIPVELIRHNFKTIQKLVEKQKKTTTEEVAKIKKAKLSAETKLELINKQIKQFESFQSKLTVAAQANEDYRSRLIARLDNLKVLEECTVPQKQNSELDEDKELDTNDKLLDPHNLKLINWYRDQTNLLLVDYLIKSSTADENTGLKLLDSLSQTNPKLERLIDHDLYADFNRIQRSILKDHDLSLVKQWFHENKNFLKKFNSNLEFEINYCQFLSLVEKGDIDTAINFSKSNLSSYGNKDNYLDQDSKNYEDNLARLREVGGLLVFLAVNTSSMLNPSHETLSGTMITKMPRFHEYEKLLSNERWESLSRSFFENFTDLNGISKNYPFFVYLSAGLLSLKTKSCYRNEENTIFNTESKHKHEALSDPLALLTDRKYRGPNMYYQILHKINNCPTCSPEMYELSKDLPFAQLITSIFNNPFKLPNGNIYPFDKLLNPLEKYLSEKNTLLRMGKIKDPLTKEIFLIDNCVRVYPA